MTSSFASRDQRGELRVSVDLPARISVGSQLSVQGHLKDISLKSAFIRLKNSIFLEINDEIGIAIQCSPDNTERLIEGLAYISRIVPGEGVAVYFTKLDDRSLNRLKKLVQGG